MIILRKIIKLVILLAMFALAIIGLRYLIHGGFGEIRTKFEELDGVWSFIKWFVLNK